MGTGKVNERNASASSGDGALSLFAPGQVYEAAGNEWKVLRRSGRAITVADENGNVRIRFASVQGSVESIQIDSLIKILAKNLNN